MDRHDIRTVADVTATVTDDLAEAMVDADRKRGRVVLCLSGGSTPLPIYRALADLPGLPWARTWIAWGDERMVDPDHEDRNERAAREALLNRVPVPEDQVLTWPWGENSEPELCAEAYALRLRKAFGDPDAESWFDLNLLGLGTDAHTAGMFPGTGATTAEGATTVTRPDSQPTARLTMTPRALSSTRRAWFVVTGEAKREALLRTLRGGDSEATPAVAIRPREELRVYTDLELGDA